MKKWIAVSGAVFLGVCALTLSFSPDVFSLVIVCLMCLIMAAGFVVGIVSAFQYADGFRNACNYIRQQENVNSDSAWLTFQQEEEIFRQKTLDDLMKDYVVKVNHQEEEGLPCSPIEQVINEEILALRSWQSVVLQIPGTLTALGLIGTFLGLIMGISGIGFSSVDAALSSISLLLNGIETAFYTSIAGVIFSILFNLSYKMIWNIMVREMGIFAEVFHKNVIPEPEEQEKQLRQKEMQQIMECLERIPKGSDYFGAAIPQVAGMNNEQRLMSEIWDALKNGDFIFYIQPRCDLNSREVVGGEALMRWNHSQLGIVSPMVFLPMLEKNGYIVKLDRYIWEEVCKTIRGWIDRGLHPVPISVNISKMDILGMDVAAFIVEMVDKYQLPPHYLEIEIAENAYMQSNEAVQEVESALRQQGFKVIIDGYTGAFTAMSTLQETHADAMKLELQLLDNAQELESSIMQPIFEQARKCRVKMYASGIENMKQLTMLRKAGCTEGQGYFLYKPLDVEQFERLMIGAGN